MRMIWMTVASVLAAPGLLAQPAQHPPGHSAAAAAAPDTARSRDETAVRQVLARYKKAIEKLDANGTEDLFAPDSAIFETGGSEGSYTQYLAHHLDPELKAFKSFAFSDYRVAVRFVGPVALATETYNYRIETKTGEIAERKGVATSVLTRTADGWKILMMHGSARKPKGK